MTVLTPCITLRDIPHSVAIETHIQKKIQKLEQYHDRIARCDVVVEQCQKHKHQGKMYACRIDVTVPNDELNVNLVQNEDVYVAIRDAFIAMRRQLKKYAMKRRGEVKLHPLSLHGRIIRIFPEQGFGFIESNGTEYYFAADSVIHPIFEELDLGMDVHFIETVAHDGLQAHRVTVGSRNHHVEE